jgi:hypothetical protein
MFNTLIYPYFNAETLVSSVIGQHICDCGNPVFEWLLRGRLPETITVTPSTITQTITPSAKNKYLQSVVVTPVETTSLTVTPSAEEQTFSAGFYNPVVVEATA